MEEMRHTAAPWECDGELVHKNGFQIAIVAANYDDYIELQQANARLIAAAPELLEALNALLDDVGRASSMIGARKARAAIAKATGDQQ